MFSFITKRSFFVNLLVAVGLVVLIAFLFFSSLGFLTRHGDSAIVPNVTGKTFQQAKADLEAKGFQVQVTDSVYNESFKPLQVVKQSPESEDVVKTGRIIFLTVNRASPPLVEMPDLRGYSIRSAQLYLEGMGLKLGDTSFVPDIARNAVKEQMYKGNTINPGTKIPMGSTIDFVLGSGLGDTESTVPDIVGMTVDQARTELSSYSVGLGAIIISGAVKDTANAYVVKQNPELKTVLPTGETVINKIRPGQLVDIWISDSPPVKDSTNVDNPSGDN